MGTAGEYQVPSFPLIFKGQTMWLRLTMINGGEPVLINTDMIESIQPDGEGTIFSAVDCSYQVKEDFETISNQIVVSGWK